MVHSLGLSPDGVQRCCYKICCVSNCCLHLTFSACMSRSEWTIRRVFVVNRGCSCVLFMSFVASSESLFSVTSMLDVPSGSTGGILVAISVSLIERKSEVDQVQNFQIYFWTPRSSIHKGIRNCIPILYQFGRISCGSLTFRLPLCFRF